MDPDRFHRRCRELERLGGWTERDARRLAELGPRVESDFAAVVGELLAQIGDLEEVREVLGRGRQPLAEVEAALLDWLRGLFSGRYQVDYAVSCWRAGESCLIMGLDPAQIHVSLARMRSRLVEAACDREETDQVVDAEALAALHRRLDLDLAIILEAYRSEYDRRQQQVERRAAAGQMASGVAHELRQPLNVLRTSAYYLLHAGNPSPEKTAEHLQRIERQVVVADRVITAMSTFAKLPAPVVVPVSLRQSLSEALESNPMPSEIEIRLACGEAVPCAVADFAQLQIVLGNLLRNAREAMPEGGCLSLSARREGRWVEISVSDTGVGIGDEDRRHILEPLYTTKPRGMGLGLAISRAIVEKHGGVLRVESEPDKGATFTVTLPAAEARTEGVEPQT